MKKKNGNRGNSGQALIITALAVSLLIISTFYYVYDSLYGIEERQQLSLDDYILMIKLGSVRTVLSSLANVTNGGENQILTRNIETLGNKLKEEFPFGYCLLSGQPWNASPYSSGFYISWGQNGYGISSCYVIFNLTIYGRNVEASLEYPVNVTTSLTVQGFYSQVQGYEKYLRLICRIFNEGSPALAQSFKIYYYNGSSWIQVQSYGLTDYGNGTYSITFNANISISTVYASVGAYDTRQIYVQTNATCSEI